MEGEEKTPRSGGGRGARLMELLRKKQQAENVGVQGSSAEASTSSGGEEPKRPMGRAARLTEFYCKKLGVEKLPDPAPLKPLVQQSYKSCVEEAEKEKRASEELKKKETPDFPAPPPGSYQGKSGKPINLETNHIELFIENDRGVFEYEVKFLPQIDAVNRRHKFVSKLARTEFDNIKIFDGGNKIYLSKLYIDGAKTYAVTLENVDGVTLQCDLTVTYKKKLSYDDSNCLHLYNVLFKRIMHKLMYRQIGRNYFNANHRQMLPQHRLEVYPGFAISVAPLDDDNKNRMRIELDTQHKVLRSDTVLDHMQEIKKTTNPQLFKQTIQQTVIGTIVMTPYNNATYSIDDILWDMTPSDRFERYGKSLSYVEYYAQSYNLTITNHDQPLLLHRQKIKNQNGPQSDKQERLICLVPELCKMTAKEIQAGNDFVCLKDIAMLTRVTPEQRVFGMRQFLKNVRESAEAQEILGNWGLKIAERNMTMKGRQMEQEPITFGNNRSITTNGDWTRDVGSNPMTATVDMEKWIIFYTERDKKYALSFKEQMSKLAPVLGWLITPGRLECLPDDQTITYVNYVKNKLASGVEMAVFIVPTVRLDRYSAIKKLCCAQLGIASQVIHSRTLWKPERLRSIIIKIALQMNCKLGGSLWTVKVPFRGWMICGIDVCHSKEPGKSVSAFVSNINDKLTRWYSRSEFQDREIGDFYTKTFACALDQFRENNGDYPSKIVIFRDGVGDQQLEQTKNYEISQFTETLRLMEIKASICFIVVQKRIHARLFAVTGGGSKLENPSPGTIMDNTVTKKDQFDFYLVPQSVRQGTATPTHYIVVYDTCQMQPEHVQRLSYKLCHLYYNWSGTIRVPAPCMYAHKLAAMVGQVSKAACKPELSDKLWFL